MRAQDKKAIERYKKKLELIRGSANINVFETRQEQLDRIERAKKDVRFCVEYYFPHYATSPTADFHVQFANRVKKDPTYTGFAKWGRGLAKSVWCNVIIPFWLWMNDGDNYFVLIGLNATRAVQLLEDIRAEFEANPRILNDFGEQKNLGSWDEDLWITKGGFIGQALGFGQSCRGLRVGPKRPKQYNVDDIETRATIKNETRQEEMVEWVENELLPTMDGASERLTFSNNWFAEVMFLKKLAEKHPDWHVHEIKAYDPVTYEPAWKSKYKPAYYINKEKKMGTIAAQAEYNHDAKPKGKIFKPEMIQWTRLPALTHFQILVGHWDIAYAGTATADFNAVRIWGLYKRNYYYITSFVKQTKMREAVTYMCHIQKGLPDGVTIHWRFEAQFWNDEVERTIYEISKLEKVNLLISKVDTPRTKKYDRILTLHPRYQNNRMYYNQEMKSHKDTQTGLKQLYGIEPNYHTKDDAPDADEQAISFLEKHITIGSGEGGFTSGKMKPKHERL